MAVVSYTSVEMAVIMKYRRQKQCVITVELLLQYISTLTAKYG